MGIDFSKAMVSGVKLPRIRMTPAPVVAPPAPDPDRAERAEMAGLRARVRDLERSAKTNTARIAVLRAERKEEIALRLRVARLARRLDKKVNGTLTALVELVAARHGVPVGAVMGMSHAPKLLAAKRDFVRRARQCGLTLEEITAFWGRTTVSVSRLAVRAERGQA